MELWDVYDRYRRQTGKTVERGGHLSGGEYRAVVHICVFNDKDEMLIQQRQPFKHGWSNMWDVTTGGCVVAGETIEAAAGRELFEEIGLRVDFTGVRPHFTINFGHGFDDYYLLDAETGLNIENLELQYEEVQRVKWASKEEILHMIGSGEFIPYHKSLIAMCFDMRRNYGAVTDRDKS
ncbi:MAG: NUDIX domain-containing protein [Defluviitaleaceae bacterium]|nr:NUDIX domain-containing protein [Defluviitaleaceae bacterium]